MMLRVDGLSVSVKGRKILDGVTFRMGKGEALGVVGTMGSGKTSLIYSIKGIIPSLKPGKVGGEIRFMGGPRAPMDRRIGVVFQNPNDQVFCSSVLEEASFGLKNMGLRGDALDGRARMALKRVGLEKRANDDPFELSQGQRQKLAIASVLAMGPDLILLDEPTSSLDHRAGLEIYDILRGLSLEGKSLMVVEHNTDYLARLGSKYLVLNDGRQIAYGGSEVFKNREVSECGVRVPCVR